MDKAVYYKFKCPRCNSHAHARMDKKVYKFLIYRCPVCESNVVYYENNVDILSDAFMESFSKNKNITYCGDALFSKISPSNGRIINEEITKDRIVDLKILLNTEKNFEKFLLKI
jgi:transcription initiation factor IIE alpha subunit